SRLFASSGKSFSFSRFSIELFFLQMGERSAPLCKEQLNAESGEAEGFSGGSGKSASEIYRDAGEACGRDCRDDPRKDQISHLVPAGKKDMEAGKVLVTEGTGRNTQLDISARHV